jgi:F-type H+-transporting ATPase subunit b
MFIATLLAATGDVAAGEMGPNPIAPENKELFWGAGTFLVFLFVMRVFLVPRVKKGMDERYEHIRSGHESADALRAAARADVAAYEAALAAVRVEAAQRLEAVRQTLDAERQSQVAAVNARIAAMRTAAEADIESARRAAADHVAGAVATVTGRAARLVLGRDADPNVIRQAVDRSMNGARS